MSESARLLTRLEGVLAALGLVLAAVTGEVALVAIAAPLALLSLVGLSRRPQPTPSVSTRVDPLVTTPGEWVTVEIDLVAPSRQTCAIELMLPAHLHADGPASFLCDLSPGRMTTVSVRVTSDRPGRFEVGRLRLMSAPPSRDVVTVSAAPGAVEVQIRPPAFDTDTLPRPEKVRALTGNRVAPLGGEGIEFADLREESGAILSRRVNWRATARRQTTCVNSFHPERSTDVVLLVDTFSPSALASVLAAAVSVSETYLTRQDRLGVVCFGGVLDWVEPGSGPRQRERVRWALLGSQAHFSFAQKTADIIPRRLLPAGALVLAVSPLVDDRFITTLISLRSQGSDVSVLEVIPPPLPPGPPPRPAPRRGRTGGERAVTTASVVLAGRILALEHEELRYRLAGWGIAVVALGAGDSLGVALDRLAATRRMARRAGRLLAGVRR